MELTGVIKTSALLRRGSVTRREVDAMVRSGGFSRIGAGWLVLAGTPARVCSPLGAGLRLTCLSGADVLGIWTPPFVGHHVYVRRGTVVPPGYLPHRPEPRVWPDADPVAPLPLLLEHTIRCQGVETGAIVVESAWNQGLLHADDVAALLARLPCRTRDSLARLRPDAQSGTETRVRWWLERQGIRVRSQQEVPGVGRVDLLVGRWVIECDSRGHHTGDDSYAADRRRDLQLRRLGYLVTRLTWEDVMLRWPETQQTLRHILRRGAHRHRMS